MPFTKEPLVVQYQLCVSDMKQPVLTTERLTLRSFNPADASTVQDLAGNYNVSKSTLNIPYPYENGMAEEWISTHLEDWNSRTRLVYAITLTGTGQLIGAISLHDIDESQGELGYWIGEPHWGKGYCTEAASALIQFSFERLNLGKIHAEHLTANPASGKVMKKIGMRHIGSERKRDRHNRDSGIELYEIRNT